MSRERARTLLITGATGGIGSATARAAHEAGWELILIGRSASVQGVAETLVSGPSVLALQADTTDFASLKGAVEAGLNSFGCVDAAFINAGVTAGPRSYLPNELESESVAGWREMVLTNVLGTALTVRAVAPALCSSRGRLILTGSVLGRYAMAGSLYSATKSAVAGIAESARLELIGTGVGVTLLEPGQVDTSFAGASVGDGGAPALAPEDVGRSVMYVLDQPDGIEINELLLRPHGATP